MRVAIMQPNFIPWLGYFKLIQAVDLFIFLDNAEYSKNTWHNRNRLYLKDSSLYTWTLPVTTTSSKATFNEIHVNQKSLKLKKIKTLFCQNFKKKNNFDIFDMIFDIISNPNIPLSHINEKVIHIMMQYLQIDVPTARASEITSEGNRSEKLLKLLNSVGASTYVAVEGARDYMLADNFIDNFKKEIEFFQFSCEYSEQKTEKKDVNLSALNYILDM